MTATIVTGNRPLHDAALEGNVYLIKHFIEIGEDVNTVNEDEETALHLAALFNHSDVIQILCEEEKTKLNTEERIGRTPLYMAVEKKHFESVEMLLKYGADPAKIPWRKTGTLLHLTAWPPRLDSVKKDQIKILRLLLPLVNPNILNDDGDSALHIALQQDNNLAVIKEIVFHPGIDLNLKNHKEETPLAYQKKRCSVLLDQSSQESYVNQALDYMKILILAGANTENCRSNHRLIDNTILDTILLKSKLEDYGERFLEYFPFDTENLLHGMISLDVVSRQSPVLPLEIKSIILEYLFIMVLDLPLHASKLLEKPNQASEFTPRNTL